MPGRSILDLGCVYSIILMLCNVLTAPGVYFEAQPLVECWSGRTRSPPPSCGWWAAWPSRTSCWRRTDGSGGYFLAVGDEYMIDGTDPAQVSGPEGPAGGVAWGLLFAIILTISSIDIDMCRGVAKREQYEAP